QLSAEGDVGQLRVGFVNSMLYRGLPRAMSRFEREHPNMEVVLGEMNSAEQAQALQRGQIDLGFVHWGRLPAEIVSEPLISDPFLCCLPAGHRLAGQARLDLAELRDEDFILFPRHVSPHYHDLIIARCVDAGFSPRIRHEARLWQTVAAMVGLGMGVALIPETLCLAWRNEVRYLEIEPAGARSEIHAILPASEPSRAAQAFLATLKSGLDDA
ncbi:LysR substrate-binding domain-containing protein, partial [Pseudomonas aeruginosa]